jgi:hypothetical protein
MTKPASKQPWALLYNLESRLSPQLTNVKRKKGRPSAPIPRTRAMMYFTAEEGRMLQKISSRIQQQFPSAKVSRSQAAGFSFRLMAFLLDNAGGLQNVEDWDSLWQRLANNEETAEKE